MKNSLILSMVCCSLMYGAGFVHPLPNNLRSIENGGTLSAIDAYQDGVGAMVIQDGRAIDNSSMNTLVFKYGNIAKENGIIIGDQVLLSGSPEDKLLAGKLYADGVSCNDGNLLSAGETWLNSVCQGGLIPNGISCSDGFSNTINDMYVNQICIGKFVTNPSCSDNDMAWNTTTNLCQKGGISTYAGIYNNSYSCPSGGSLSGTTCLKSSTYGGTYNNSYSCPSGGSLSGTTCLQSSTYPATTTLLVFPTRIVYSCPSGGTLSGTNCIINQNYTATNSPYYTCPSGGSLSGSTCTINENYTATNSPYYTCPSGGSLSGSTCTINMIVTAQGICQSGYTLTNNTCVQN